MSGLLLAVCPGEGLEWPLKQMQKKSDILGHNFTHLRWSVTCSRFG